MFSLKFWKFKVAALQATKVLTYAISAPFALLMLWFGGYFVLSAFVWAAIFSAFVIVGLVVFEISFFMAIVAIFESSIWANIGSIWTWLWNWFTAGHLFVWPHVAKTFLPYMGYGIVFITLVIIAKEIKKKAALLKSKATA